MNHIYPFECDFFGVGTAGFRNQCSYCDEVPRFMKVLGRGKRRRCIALCRTHAEKSGRTDLWHEDKLSERLKEAPQ
jgi:hypothetical protein